MKLLNYLLTGIDNIQNGNGFVISAIGMLIVFLALALISVFIALLPRALKLASIIIPDEASRVASEDEQVVAAISTAMHYHKYVQSSEKV